MAANPQRVDVHHHMFPTPYLARERDRLMARLGVNPAPLLAWTPARSVEEMDKHGIATAIASISTPGIWFGDNRAACDLARECNEYAARMVQDHPGRFGFFAATPLPDPDGSLREIEYALDVLKADGVGLLTSYDDRWPGDPAFFPVFEELNRRRAVVFIHPTAPACCRNLTIGIPPAITEFLFDTTRAISSLLFNGVLSRCSDIRFIFCHCGGTMTVLAHRMADFGARQPEVAERLPNGVLYELKRLHFDIANATYAPNFAAIRALIPLSQMLFGSDYPFVPMEATTGGIPQLGLPVEQWRAIDRDNALRLLPRLRG
ncbi:MAG TPA: amidohydrolase family protein [Candidatus Binataceae bacterium]|nr:amidohydrolase family protein [Candidatus Binataceae bacterium]